MKEKVEVLIIGAGLSGLSAALHLGKKCKVRILEKENRPGGLAITDEEDGYRFDRTGHLLHLRNPEIKRLLLKLMKNEMLLVKRESRIWSNGTYTLYPFQSNTFGLPPEVSYECLIEYLRILFEPYNKPVKNFRDFIYAKFGKGFARHFMIPYNKKIWGVDPREMTTLWCDRFVPVPKMEDVIAGAVGLKDPQLGYNAYFFYPRSGIGDLPKALADEVSNYSLIEYNAQVTSVDIKNRIVYFNNGDSLHYEFLINTIELKKFIFILSSLPAGVKNAAKLLRFKPLYYLDIALNKPAGKPFHWIYVPSPKVPFYRVGSYSNFSSAVVPQGCGSLYVELSSRKKTDLKTAMCKAIPWLKEMGLVEQESDVKFARLRCIECAYVIYDKNYSKCLETIHPFLKKHNIYSIGRFGSWNYSAMEDAIIDGKNTAVKILS